MEIVAGFGLRSETALGVFSDPQGIESWEGIGVGLGMLAGTGAGIGIGIGIGAETPREELERLSGAIAQDSITLDPTQESLTFWPSHDTNNTLTTAQSLGILEDSIVLQGSLGEAEFLGLDTQDYFQFQIEEPSRINLTLDYLSADADLEILDAQGNVLLQSNRWGTATEAITYRVEQTGFYYARVIWEAPQTFPLTLPATDYELRLVSLESDLQVGDRTYPDGVSFWRYDAQGQIEQGVGNEAIATNQNTILVIHGNNPDGRSLREDTQIESLAKQAATAYPAYQVLALDWKKPAANGKDLVPLESAQAIQPVALWAKATLESLGLSADQISIFGHSLGSYVGAEIGRLLNQVNALVALDPAFPAQNYDINGNEPGQQKITNFNLAATRSIAFVASDERGGIAGDNNQAATAQASFIVQFEDPRWFAFTALEYHGGVVEVFSSLLQQDQLMFSGYSNNWFGNRGGRYRNPRATAHEGVIVAHEVDGVWQADQWGFVPGDGAIAWV